MSRNKETLTVIITGVPYEVDTNDNAPLHTVVQKALQQSNNTGQPKENWVLRDEQGTILDLEKKVGDYGFTDDTKLFLNVKEGVGG